MPPVDKCDISEEPAELIITELSERYASYDLYRDNGVHYGMGHCILLQFYNGLKAEQFNCKTSIRETTEANKYLTSDYMKSKGRRALNNLIRKDKQYNKDIELLENHLKEVLQE